MLSYFRSVGANVRCQQVSAPLTDWHGRVLYEPKCPLKRTIFMGGPF